MPVWHMVLSYKGIYVIYRDWATDWTATGPQDQLRSGSTGPLSSSAGPNYHPFVTHKYSVGLEDQLQQKSTGLANK